jgi:predicted DNA binding CopG/RHH family protein
MKLDAYETEILEAYESGKIKPVVNKAELQRLRASARATAIKDRRVNIRLSSGDLQDIQAKALEEGMPYQTLIASILHKYVTGRLTEGARTASLKPVQPKKPLRAARSRKKNRVRVNFPAVVG